MDASADTDISHDMIHDIYKIGMDDTTLDTRDILARGYVGGEGLKSVQCIFCSTDHARRQPTVVLLYYRFFTA